MDRLFRKRTASFSTPEKQSSRPSSRSKKDQAEALPGRLRRDDSDGGGNGNDHGIKGHENHIAIVESQPPSLDLDFRSSLILPALTQRFSVLLPSLSTAPEDTIKSLFASQRARQDGPSITEEEEELVLAEIRQTAGATFHQDWDGRPQFSRDWDNSVTMHGEDENRVYQMDRSENLLSTSTSSPSLFAELSPISSSTHPSSFNHSPIPTSSSMSSIQSLVNGSNVDSLRTKSYGFGGGSAMRDGEYIRRVKKSASARNLNSNDGEDKEEKTPRDRKVSLPRISPEKANAYYVSHRQKRSDSPSGSERTATPTPSLFASSSSLPRPKRTLSPSAASALNLPPQLPPPSGELPPVPEPPQVPRTRGKRQSLLAGLSPAQMKRISRALEEIEGRLDGRSPMIQKSIQEAGNEIHEGDEEVLDQEHEATQNNDHHVLQRQSSTRSNRSTHSDASNQFPFKMSPASTGHEHAATINSSCDTSPLPKLPPSPRTHDLRAHLELDPIPVSQPILITSSPSPSSSNVYRNGHSSHTSISQVSPIPGYIPGQPRPIGSYHQSDASVSRSMTPLSQSPSSPALTARSSTSKNSGRTRSGSSPGHGPPIIAPRTTSLARSKSVNQSPGRGAPIANPDHPNTSPSASRLHLDHSLSTASRRLSSSLSGHLPSSTETIQEDDNEDVEDYPSRMESPTVINVKDVLGRFSVAESMRLRESASSMGSEARQFLESSPLYYPTPISATSITNSAPHPETKGTPHTLRRQISDKSMGSSYFDQDEESAWENVLGVNLAGADASASPSSGLQRPSETDAEKILVEDRGIDRRIMANLQDKLVKRAKAEREALRSHLDNSPVLPTTSMIIKHDYSHLKPRSRPLSPAQGGTSPPPTSWKFPPGIEQAPLRSRKNSQSGTVADVSTSSSSRPIIPQDPQQSEICVNDPSTSNPKGVHHARSPSDPSDEHVFTPSTVHLSRQSSTTQPYFAQQSSQTPPDLDPEKVRDFHARIAAATAALNRTPSRPGRLERKITTGKRPGAMVISSPQLITTSAHIPGTPDTPDSKGSPASTNHSYSHSQNGHSVDVGMAKALEKTSGSSSKMSLRWKKMTGFRKGPSFSANEGETPYPPSPPVSDISKFMKSDQSSPSQLDAPIALRSTENTPAPADLKAFKFPSSNSLNSYPLADSTKNDREPANGIGNLPSPPGTANPTTGLKQMMTKLRRGRSDEQAHDQDLIGRSASTPRQAVRVDREIHDPTKDEMASNHPVVDSHIDGLLPPANATAPLTTLHSPTPSDDSAVANFIAAGKAVGLDDARLNEMLMANGMLNRSATTNSSKSVQSTAPTTNSFSLSSGPASPTLPPAEKRNKGMGGLFRNLSRGRKLEQPVSSLDVAPASPRLKETVDKVVVRRTLLIPNEDFVAPSTPKLQAPSPLISQESPDSAVRVQGQRKLSIKRKPLKLTGADRELVQGSPTRSAMRSPSQGTTHTTSSPLLPASAGPEFLQPPSLASSERARKTSADSAISEGKASLQSGFSPGRSDTSRQSSGGGSLFDLYGDDGDVDGENGGEELLHSPEATPGARRVSEQSVKSKTGSVQAVEITEYEDGEVVWSVVDALRAGIPASQSNSSMADPRSSQYSDLNSHSRHTSGASELSKFGASSSQTNGGDARGVWGPNGSTGGLNFRHRDRGVTAARPETNVYFTSPNDVADLIDHLSRDLDTSSRGRIDFNNLSVPPSPLPTGHPVSTTSPPFSSGSTDPQPNPAFEDAPSPLPKRKGPPPPLSPTRNISVPAGGFSPKRQAFLRSYGANPGHGHRSGLSSSSMTSGNSPSTLSFASSSNSQDGPRTVEDRLQALLDKLQAGGGLSISPSYANGNGGGNGTGNGTTVRQAL